MCVFLGGPMKIRPFSAPDLPPTSPDGPSPPAVEQAMVGLSAAQRVGSVLRGEAPRGEMAR